MWGGPKGGTGLQGGVWGLPQVGIRAFMGVWVASWGGIRLPKDALWGRFGTLREAWGGIGILVRVWGHPRVGSGLSGGLGSSPGVRSGS